MLWRRSRYSYIGATFSDVKPTCTIRRKNKCSSRLVVHNKDDARKKCSSLSRCYKKCVDPSAIVAHARPSGPEYSLQLKRIWRRRPYAICPSLVSRECNALSPAAGISSRGTHAATARICAQLLLCYECVERISWDAHTSTFHARPCSRAALLLAIDT